MRKTMSVVFLVFVLCSAFSTGAFANTAPSAAKIDHGVDAALQRIFDTTPMARDLAKDARGILVFPKVVKAGFVIGGQHGYGALRQEGKTTGYYETVAASYGLQAGYQQFGYALFLMSDSAMENLRTSNGWDLGSNPSVVIVDKAFARSFTTTTARKDVYAFFFGNKGLMVGFGLQGTKINRITPGMKH